MNITVTIDESTCRYMNYDGSQTLSLYINKQLTNLEHHQIALELVTPGLYQLCTYQVKYQDFTHSGHNEDGFTKSSNDQGTSGFVLYTNEMQTEFSRG